MSAQKTKIVLIVPVFPQISETFVVGKFVSLIDKGWDCHVICNSSSESGLNFFPQLQSRYNLMRRIHVNWRTSPEWLKVIFFPFAFLKCFWGNPKGLLRYFHICGRPFGIKALNRFYLDSQLIALKPDLIHFEFGALATGRMYLREALNCKIIVSFRGYDLNIVGLGNSGYYKEIWDRAEGLHFVSQAMIRQAERRGMSQTRKCIVISSTVDHLYFEPSPRSIEPVIGTKDRTFRILSVGRLVWEKGYEYGLKSVQILIERGVHCDYQIVGHGVHQNAIVFAIHEMNLQDHVTLLFSQPLSEVRNLMQWADVFLHSSVTEGFGEAVLEAQSMALPVVCSDAGGLGENVVDGETGFVVSSRNSEALAEKLALLSKDPDLRTRMGEAGRKRVMTHFRFEDQIAKWDRFLSDILENSGGSTEAIHSTEPATVSGKAQG